MPEIRYENNMYVINHNGIRIATPSYNETVRQWKEKQK